MDVNINIKLVGILAIVGLSLILSYFSYLAGNAGLTIIFLIFAIAFTLIFLVRGGASGD
jgi:hypothetical protein